MASRKENALRIVRELHQYLTRVYGARLKGVYLFGSYARDEATDDSDMDVAIVLSGVLNRADEARRVSGQLSEICLRENALISALFISEEEWTKRPLAIHRSVSREGIAA
ncbi:MAG: nucleotidyltransferase domain-containing protein [Nitrospinae bacterium]|nr:nucleotidyltransferase domain-containing protein [Nitrospinota bacterium]MBF0633156.1 nucleotidyltransferase domain-containing protein [Nitrospinota bacterium]